MRINGRFLAWTLALYPWLSNYGTFVEGMTVGDIFLIIDLICCLMNRRHNKLFLRSSSHIEIFALFIAYCLLSLIIGAIFHEINPLMVVKRFLKFGLFVVSILLLVQDMYNKETFARAFTIVSRASCIAIILQYIAYYTVHYYIEFKIPLLHYSNDIVDSIDRAASQAYVFRPTSIFLEPAHFTYFISCYLVFLLFYPKRDSRLNRIIESIIVTTCMVMSVSSTAIVIVAVIWVYYALQLVINRKIEIYAKHRLIIMLGITIVGIIGIRYYLNSPSLSYSLERMMYSKNANLASSVWGRVESGEDYFKQLDPISKVFGIGLGNMPSTSSYFSSIYYVLYCTGIIGAAIIVCWMIKTYISTNQMGRLILIIFLAFCFSSPIIISGYFIEFLILLDISNKYSEELQKNLNNQI